MSSRRKTKPAPVPPAAPPSADELLGSAFDVEEITPAAKLTRWREALGDADGGVLEVYQVGARGKHRYLLQCEPDRYAPAQLFDALMENYGPGDYVILGRADAGTIQLRIPVSLGPETGPRAAPFARPAEQPAPDRAGNTASSSDARIVQLLEAQQRTLEALTATLAQRPRERDTLELLKEAAALKELFAPPPATSNVIEQIKDLLTIKEQLAGDGGGDDALTTAVRTLGPSIVEAVKSMNAAKGSRTERAYARARAAAQPTDAAPTAPGAATVGLNPLASIFAMYLPSVLELAAAGVTPQDAAQRIADMITSLPEGTANAVLNFLDESDAESLAKIDARVASHGQWINDTLDALVEIFSDESAPDESHSAQAGNGIDQNSAVSSRPSAQDGAVLAANKQP